MRNYLFGAAAAALAIAWPMAAQAQLKFQFDMISGDSLTTEQSAAFQAAADAWSSYLTDPITIRLQVGFSSNLGTNVLGATSPTLRTYMLAGTAGLQARYLADAKDTADQQAAATLATSTATSVRVTTAEAKALGYTINAATYDASIEFSSSYAFSTSRNADGSIAANTYDLIGIAEHEIGHALGFVSGIDFSSTIPTLMDEFRYSAAGTRSYAKGASAYFSIDSGITDIGDLADGNSDQASHWTVTTDAVMRPEAAAGVALNITDIDLRAFDALGYDLAATPEPATWAMMIVGFGAIGAGMRQRRMALRPA